MSAPEISAHTIAWSPGFPSSCQPSKIELWKMQVLMAASSLVDALFLLVCVCCSVFGQAFAAQLHSIFQGVSVCLSELTHYGNSFIQGTMRKSIRILRMKALLLLEFCCALESSKIKPSTADMGWSNQCSEMWSESHPMKSCIKCLTRGPPAGNGGGSLSVPSR